VWAKPEYVGEERSGVRVLTVNPKGLPTRLDKFVDWNVALSSPAQWDMYLLSRSLGLSARKPLVPPSLSMQGNQIVRMRARDAFNHIGAMNDTSWLIVYSSTTGSGTLSIYPDEE